MITTPSRATLDLTAGWIFLPERAARRWMSGRAEGGEAVTLPHCWNERDTYQFECRAATGWGSYRTTASVPESTAEGHWRLRAGGFYGVGDVWLDGRRISRFDAQFLGLDIACGDLTPGRHVLGVRTDNRFQRNVLPGFDAPDFLLYGGLTGRAWLEWRPDPAFDGHRLAVETSIARGHGTLTLRHPLEGPRPLPPGAVLSARLTDDSGREVAAASRPVLAGESWSTELLVDDPRPWSPADPVLYRAEVTLEAEGRTLDAIGVRFGFADAEFRRGDGFFLNGERVLLHGANRHESIPGLGAALPPELHRRDAEVLKELGANFVRLSHYPQHPAFLDACDELGLLVYPEIATWKSVRSSRRWLAAAERQMRALILRDRHRPSHILWGMGNESRSRTAYRRLAAVVAELDPGRPTIYAENHLYRARRRKTVGLPDVWGTNYELDVLTEAAASSTTGLVIVSECCNHPKAIKGEEVEELVQLNAIERDWEAMADRPQVAGYAVWCLTDYATEHRDRVRRRPGLLDAWRRPKMAAELFRARHARAPFIAVFVTGPGPERPPSRFRREIVVADGATDIHVFSNCRSLALAIDGGEPHRLADAVHWVVTVAAPPDRVTARSEIGADVVTTTWRRHGPARSIRVTAQEAAGPGRTVAVDLDVVDSRGTVVRDWNGSCRVSAVGAGRLRTYTEAAQAEISRGEGRVYLTCDPAPSGEVRILASAEGPLDGSAVIRW